MCSGRWRCGGPAGITDTKRILESILQLTVGWPVAPERGGGRSNEGRRGRVGHESMQRGARVVQRGDVTAGQDAKRRASQSPALPECSDLQHPACPPASIPCWRHQASLSATQGRRFGCTDGLQGQGVLEHYVSPISLSTRFCPWCTLWGKGNGMGTQSHERCATEFLMRRRE